MMQADQYHNMHSSSATDVLVLLMLRFYGTDPCMELYWRDTVRAWVYWSITRNIAWSLPKKRVRQARYALNRDKINARHRELYPLSCFFQKANILRIFYEHIVCMIIFNMYSNIQIHYARLWMNATYINNIQIYGTWYIHPSNSELQYG